MGFLVGIVDTFDLIMVFWVAMQEKISFFVRINIHVQLS